MGVGNATGVGGPVALRRRGTGSGTFTGSGQATGVGTAIGFGSASGYGTVIGSGTANGTGTFIGQATAVGSGTIIGVGTVLVGGLIPVVSSGTVTGSGTVIGVGTIYGVGRFVGSGTFVGSPGTFSGTGTVSTMGVGFPLSTKKSGGGTTVNVYINDCGPTGLPRLALNGSMVLDPSPGIVMPVEDTTHNPLCHVCTMDAAICCPWTVSCGGDGHCPWSAMLGAGYIVAGAKVAS
jgi:hypothetical protein